MYPTLELVREGSVKQIVHASDIHIRTGDLERSRYEEYRSVISEFVKQIPTENTVVVLTGDIFHNKGKIEPPGICLAHFLLDELLKKADVLMICGNHDYRQEDPDIPDMIYSMYHRYFEHRVQSAHKAYYLNQTGYYRYKNILFTVLDIRDVLKSYNTAGKVEGVVYPPCPEKEEGMCAVGLYHGFYTTGYSPEFNPQWQGYDFMLLGDIHKYSMTKQGGCLWGYPGSLVQQDFGESFFEHGYLVWDIEQRKSSFVEIFNDWGFCTVQCRGNDIYLHVRGKKWISLSTLEKLPNKAAVRVLKKEDSGRVQRYWEERGGHPRGIQVWNSVSGEEFESEAVDMPRHSLEELNAGEKWLEFLGEDKFRGLVEDPTGLALPPGEYGDIAKKVAERNSKIGKAVDEFVNYCSVEGAPRVYLLNMEWAYLMCYGEHNVFDFKRIDGQIALLNGKNAMGKSSFLDVICIGLFGDPTKMRQMITGKKYSDKIIHTNKPAKTAPYVKIVLAVGEEVYELYRAFGTQSSRENSILQTAVKVYKVEGEKRNIYLEGTTLVNRWVEKTIGSMEAVLMSTMLCQVDLNNFFYLKQDEQRAILDKALQLDKVSLYGQILKEACLGYSDVLRDVVRSKETVGSMLVRDSYDEGELEKLGTEIEELQQLRALYASYITKKVPGKECESAFKQSEMEWQMLGLKEVDLETYYRNKERLEQLRKQWQRLEGVTVYKNGEELLEKWQGRYKEFLAQEPKCEVSAGWVKQTLKDYEKWCEKEELDVEAAVTAFKGIEQRRLQFKMSEPPKYKKRSVVSSEVSVPSKRINLEEYAHLEGMALPKKKGWQQKKKELDDVSKVLDTMQIEYCEGCPACQVNQNYLEKLSSYKSQLEKYLEGLGNWEELELVAVYQENRAYNDWLWWQYEQDMIMQKQIVAEYNQCKMKLEKAQQYALEKKKWEEVVEKARRYKSILDDYEVWQAEHLVIQEKLQKYTQSVEKKKLEKELQQLEEEFSKNATGVECFVAYDRYKNEHYNYKLAEVEKRYHSAHTKRTQILAQKEHYAKQKRLFDNYSQLEKTLEDKLQLIKALDSRFIGDKNNEGYKEWIYKEKVIPLINQHMNAFLEQFEEFTFKMEYKNKCFVYLLQDRGNSPTLDKASGYQNFITGLGLRITLAKLGAVGQQFKHLFIDEGFTACDAVNMAKVPALLQSVMNFGQYKSIVLMSHLENVRDCASMVIDIERKGAFSYIKAA